jgi:predicted ester cyclase
MHLEAARALVAPFYEALNQPATKDVRALVESVVHPEWRSFAGEGLSKDREAFIGQVMGFGKLIPDLTWEIKEVVAAEGKIVVRSEARGTPVADFMGVPPRRSQLRRDDPRPAHRARRPPRPGRSRRGLGPGPASAPRLSARDALADCPRALTARAWSPTEARIAGDGTSSAAEAPVVRVAGPETGAVQGNRRVAVTTRSTPHR